MAKKPLTELLQRSDQEWFQPDLIAALQRSRLALKSAEAKHQLASELTAEGYELDSQEQGSAGYKRLGPDHFLVLKYLKALVQKVWPGELRRALWDRLHTPDSADAGALIRFLEIDPFFFRSGYMKKVAIHRLRSCPIGEDHSRRLFQIVRRIVLSGWRTQVSDWRLLAQYCDRNYLVNLVREGLESTDLEVKWRATELGLVVLRETEILGRFRWPLGNWRTDALPVVEAGMANVR